MQNQTIVELEFQQVLAQIAKYCLTQKGKELLLVENSILNTAVWDSQILLNRKSPLQNELKQLAEMTQLLTTDEAFPIERIEDVQYSIQKSKIDGAVLEIQEIKKIVEMTQVARNIKLFIKNRKEKYNLLYNEIETMYDNSSLQKQLNDTIDENGNIKDNATKELAKIRAEIREKNSQLHSKMTKIAKEFADEEYTQDNFYTLRDGRFVLPIKANYKRQLTGIIHGASQTGSTVYLEPAIVVEMNNQLSLLHSAELREIHEILKKFTKEISNNHTQLAELYETFGHIDTLFAKANYALTYGGIEPHLTNEKILELQNVYHPLLVHQLGRKSVVPLTISFCANKRGHLISGPNAGGKTIAMKTVGLAVLMALNGIFPLGEIKLCPLNVYSAIGDGQSVEQNLSTFSSQLTRIKRIMDVADYNSLVLIDEICAGTDPREGSALAAGILDTFIELNLFFMVTTHQSSLKTYALNTKKYSENPSTKSPHPLLNGNLPTAKNTDTENIDNSIYLENKFSINPKDAVLQNDSFAFDKEQLKPTYIFQSGLPGNSYAFFLAKTVGIPSLVLKRAKKYLGGHQKQLEKSISVLNKHKKEYEDLVLECRKNNLKLEELKSDYENKKKELLDKRKQIINDAKIEANEILQKSNALVENTIRTLKDSQRAADMQAIRKEFNEQKSSLEKEVVAIQQSLITKNDNWIVPTNLKIADNVTMLGNSEVGTVLEANDTEQTALIAFGRLKFRLSYKQLVLTENIEKNDNNRNFKQFTTKKTLINFGFESKLDLRGFRADKALVAAQKFISQALDGNAEFVNIIHGKGTGVLRTVIHNYLGSAPEIKSFRLGELYEGGDGITVVYFR